MSLLAARVAGHQAAMMANTMARAANRLIDSTDTLNDSSPWSANAFTTIQPSDTPRPTPITTPSTAVTKASQRMLLRTCGRVMPMARTRPSSRRRSYTASSRVMTMPSTAMNTDISSSA